MLYSQRTQVIKRKSRCQTLATPPQVIGQKGPRGLQTRQAITITLGCPQEPDDAHQNLLLKTPYMFGCRTQRNQCATGLKTPSQWVTFTVVEVLWEPQADKKYQGLTQPRTLHATRRRLPVEVRPLVQQWPLFSGRV